MAQQYTLPKLAYSYEALEPILSRELVEIHYSKHHAGYVTNLNKAMAQLEIAEKKEDLDQQIALHALIKFNGGGHRNHTLYWENIAPVKNGGGELPKGPLYDALLTAFPSIEVMKETLTQQACALQGSGWAWLGYHPERKQIEMETTPNHDLLLATKGLHPLLCIDMWEHAFYLSYKNVKTEYVKALWSLVNWRVVEERFLATIT